MKFQSNSIFNGTITANSVADAGSNTDKFLVLSSSGVVSYRTAAELYADLGIGALPAGYTSTVKHEVKAGVAINKGQAVYVTSANGTNMIVGLASNTAESTSSKTLGLIESTLAINGIGNVITEGLLAGLDTTGANAVGDPVWLGTNGDLIYGLTNKPYAPSHLVFIGVVTRINANNGEIFVKVQNGFELDELHNIDLKTTAPSNGEILGYNGTLWVNKTIAGWLGYTPVTNARTLTINGTSYDLSADRTWTISSGVSGTTNYIPVFSGSTTIGNSNIYKSGALIGINTTSPNSPLHVYNSASSGDTTAAIALDTVIANNAVDIRFGSSNPVALRIYASSSALTASPSGAGFQAFSNASASFPGQIYFDSGAHNSAALIFRTAQTSGTITTRMRIESSGTIKLSSYTSNGFVKTSSSDGTITIDTASYTPTTRTITINGTAYDLSANRSWTIDSMVYPAAGIAVSTGTAWGTSITDNSSNWNTAYGWGNHASAGYVLGTRTLTINGTTYDLSANRSWTIDSTSVSTRTVQKYTADGSSATYTVTGGYTVGLVDVYVNGIKLDNASGVEFTATNGTTVVLVSTPASGDIVEVYKYGSQFIANNALRQSTVFTATAGQNTFTVSYSVGMVDVFYNGSKLSASEYTATNGTSIVLGTNCIVNDIVEVIAYTYSVGAFSGVNGSGTTNYISKWTASGTLGNSIIYDNGTSVGIGITSPITSLEVLSSQTNSSIKTGGLELQSYAADNVWIGANNYYNGGDFYRSNGAASKIQFASGGIYFKTAGAGTAGAALTFNQPMAIFNSGNVQINGPVYRYNGTTAIGGSMTTLVNANFSSSRTYLIQIIPLDASASTNYRYFGILQYNYNANSYAITPLAYQTMDVAMSGGNIQARTINSQQFTFDWSITQLL